MFCSNCGNKVEDSERFCSSCGSQIELEETTTTFSNSPEKKETMSQSNSNTVLIGKAIEFIKNTFSRIPIVVWRVVASFVVVVTLGIVIIGNMDHKINVEDYITITFDGCNGYGIANVNFDQDEFALDVLKYSKIKGVDTKELKSIETRNAYDTYEEFADMQETAGIAARNAWRIYEEDMDNADFYYEIDKNIELKNGDEVTISYNFHSEIYEEYGIKLVAEPKTYSVAGLQDAKVYDAFEDYTVVFSGISPYITAEVIVEDNTFDYYISYELDKESGIKKGDKVTLSLYVEQNDLARDMGYCVAETSKEYVCENVSAYVTKLDEIPADTLEAMNQQAIDSLTAYIALDWNNPSTFKKQTLVGNYLLTAKNNGNEYVEELYNYLYYIYKVDVKTDEEKFSFYYYVCFNDVTLLPDGTCSVDLSNYTQPDGGWYSDETFTEGGLTYRGYKKLETLKSKCITTKIDEYNYETNIEE